MESTISNLEQNIINLVPSCSKIKAVIVLYGKNNCGKTETLKTLSPQTINAKSTRATMVCNNKTVAICSAGDTAAEILANISYAVTTSADIFVTAARINKTRKGQVLDAIKIFTEEIRGCCYVVVFLNKEKFNQKWNTAPTATQNKDLANHIMQLINQATNL